MDAIEKLANINFFSMNDVGLTSSSKTDYLSAVQNCNIIIESLSHI